eukprot:tig00000144_g9061.t1
MGRCFATSGASAPGCSPANTNQWEAADALSCWAKGGLFFQQEEAGSCFCNPGHRSGWSAADAVAIQSVPEGPKDVPPPEPPLQGGLGAFSDWSPLGPSAAAGPGGFVDWSPLDSGALKGWKDWSPAEEEEEVAEAGSVGDGYAALDDADLEGEPLGLEAPLADDLAPEPDAFA